MLNPELPEPEESRKYEQELIDTAEPLTEEEIREKEELLEKVHGSLHSLVVMATIDLSLIHIYTYISVLV